MVRRRTFKPDLKARVVLEVLTGARRATDICREERLKPQVLSRWKAEFLERAPEIFATERSRGDEQERISELERLLGRQVLEIEVLKKASSILTSLSNRSGR